MASLQKAKEVIRKQLNKGELTPDAISVIEGQMEEIKNLDWKKDKVLLGLHKRYLVQLEQIENNKSGDFQKTIEGAKRRHEALRGSANIISPEQKLMLRRAFLNNPRLKSQMGKLGVKFKGDEVIIPVGFEKTPEYAQMQLYMRGLYMTSSPEYTDTDKMTDKKRREKMQLYFDLVRESGDFIIGKEYLGYKLIHSMYEDLKRDSRGPFLMARDGLKGEYDIVCFPITRDDKYNITSKKAPDSHPYNELVKFGKVRSEYIEFASTYSIVERNHTAFRGKEFMGQKTLVMKIINKHGITGVSSEDLQNPRTLMADWPEVKEDIEDKMKKFTDGDSRSLEAYEELAYLHALIDGKEWLREQTNLEVFQQINTYGKGFLKEKALINEGLGLHTGGAGKESTGEALTSSVNSVALPIVALGVFTMLFGGEGSKNFGFAAIAALLGANVAGGLIDKVGDFTGNPLTGENPGDTLELIRLRQLQYSIKGGDAINGVLSTLYTENDARLKNTTTTASRDLFIQEPEKIGKILFEISQDDDISKLDTSDVDLADKIYTALQTKGKLAIKGTEFTSRLSKKPTVTRDDVNAFVEILKSQADGNDSTLSDLLVAGDVDILNKNYESFDFTIDSVFDTEINNHLRTIWDANKDNRKGRKSIEKLKTTIENSISSGTWTDDWWTSTGKRAYTDIIEGLPAGLQTIDDLIQEIDNMPGINSATTDDLIKDPDGLLLKYKTFLQADAEVSKYDSTGAEFSNFFGDTLETLDRTQENARGVKNVEELTEEKRILDEMIIKLDPTRFSVNGSALNISGEPLFSSLRTRILNKRAELTEKSNEKQEEINKRNAAFRNSITGVIANPDVDALDMDETKDEYRDSVENIMKTSREFADVVKAFKNDNKVTVALSSENAEKYNLLQKAHKKLLSLSLSGTASIPNKKWLLEQIAPAFLPTGPVEAYKTMAKAQFEIYFTEGVRVQQEVKRDISSNFTDSSQLLENVRKLNEHEAAYKSLIGYGESIYAFVKSADKSTETEKAYKRATDVFEGTFTVAGSNVTAEKVISEIIQKRNDVAQGVSTYINSISTNDIVTLKKLKEMKDRRVIEFARDTELGPLRSNTSPETTQIETDYATKVQNVTVAVIGAIPSTPAGITQLKELSDILEIESHEGLYQRVKDWLLGNDYLQEKFEEKVTTIGTTVLESFTSGLPGLSDLQRLGKIIDFKSDPSGNYLWIEGRSREFKTRYNEKVAEMREIVKTRTKVRELPALNTTVNNVTLGIPNTGTNARAGQRRALGSFVTSASTKTISTLMTTLNIQDILPTGEYGGFKENERQDIYNTLKTLKIIG